jgi:transcriptional regulator with XRE-family HTH domain
MPHRKQEKERLAQRLKQARERAHVSLEDAAEAASVQPLAVEKWESGKSLPGLLEFRSLMECYGTMPAYVLYAAHPLELSAEQCAELAKVSKQLSPGLQAKLSVLLAIVGPGKEPVWKGVAAVAAMVFVQFFLGVELPLTS